MEGQSSKRTPPTEEEWDSLTIGILGGVSSLRLLSALLINDGNQAEADVVAIGALVEMVGDRIEELLELKGDTFVCRLNREGVAG